MGAGDCRTHDLLTLKIFLDLKNNEFR